MNHDEPTTYSNIIQHNPVVSIGCMSSSYGSHRVLKSPTSASISIWRPTLPAQTHLTRISDKVPVISAYGIHRHCGIPFPILSFRQAMAAIALAMLLPSLALAEKWAVIAAGSQGWSFTSWTASRYKVLNCYQWDSMGIIMLSNLNP